MAQDNDPLADSASPDEGSTSQSKAAFKVELDLEDAPFLEEEEAPAPEKKTEQQSAASAPPPPQKEEAPGKLEAFFANKKRLAIIGGGLVVLLLAPLVLMLLRGKEPPPPAPEIPEPVRKVAPATPPREDAPAGPRFVFQAEPFFVERRGSEGQLRFLRCRIAVPTDNQALMAELQAKNIAVRDAIYYYLRNRPLTFLDDEQAQVTLKIDLISVINEHCTADKITELYIEEYFVTGM